MKSKHRHARRRTIGAAGIQRLEPRRLLAAWGVGPAFDPNDDTTYYYHVDETGWHWEAEIGETGKSKTYERGRLFRAEYDESFVPYEGGAASPDPQEFYARLLERLGREYGWRMQDRPVEFSILEHGGGVFEVVATPTAPPQWIRPAPAEPSNESRGPGSDVAQSPPPILDGGFIEFGERVALDVPAAVPEPAAQPMGYLAPQSRPIFGAWSDAIVSDDREDALAPIADRAIESELD